MRRPPRIAVLLTVFAAVAIWTIWMIQDEGTTVPTSPIAPGLAPQDSRSWAPPSPPAFVSAPPQVPVAPPLPYRFVGEIVLPTETWAFLARENDVFRVREGGTIGGEYKVESVKADELVLLHLASGVHQTARLASPGGENPGTGPQTAQAPDDSAALAPRGDARSIGPATVSVSPSEEPVQPVRPRPHRIRRRAESTD